MNLKAIFNKLHTCLTLPVERTVNLHYNSQRSLQKNEHRFIAKGNTPIEIVHSTFNLKTVPPRHEVRGKLEKKKSLLESPTSKNTYGYPYRELDSQNVSPSCPEFQLCTQTRTKFLF